MDALSLTRERVRERVRVRVCAPLPHTRTHWRRRRILTSGDFSRPVCILSPTLSRNFLRERVGVRVFCPRRKTLFSL
jgi:hypothetical protein